MNKNKIIPSCSMCRHFDSLQGMCNIYNEAIEAENTERAVKCESEGNFVRDLNVLPDSYNIFPGERQENWSPDFSKLPKDSQGLPLYVITNRGYERAIPAYVGVELKASSYTKSVPRYMTYQGQREMAYELGYELAKKVIEEKGYEFHALPEEELYEGFEEFKRHYLFKKPKGKKHVLLSDKPIEVWD